MRNRSKSVICCWIQPIDARRAVQAANERAARERIQAQESRLKRAVRLARLILREGLRDAI